jgi:hypothetical protein
VLVTVIPLYPVTLLCPATVPPLTINAVNRGVVTPLAFTPDAFPLANFNVPALTISVFPSTPDNHVPPFVNTSLDCVSNSIALALNVKFAKSLWLYFNSNPTDALLPRPIEVTAFKFVESNIPLNEYVTPSYSSFPLNDPLLVTVTVTRPGYLISLTDAGSTFAPFLNVPFSSNA